MADAGAEALSQERFERWMAALPADRGGQRLGQAFLNSPLAAAMRRLGRVDPKLFYERDEALAAAAIAERYVGKAPRDQGLPWETI